MTPKVVRELGKRPFVASREKDTEKKGMYRQRTIERTDELERLRRRYAGRGQTGKGRLLDEFCEHHGYDRKYAIKRLHAGPPPPGLPASPTGSPGNETPRDSQATNR